MTGAAVGAMGGLFSLGIVPAVALGDPRVLLNTPLLNGLCWVVSLLIGWSLGSLLGVSCGRRFRSERAEIAGGALGGVATIGLGALIGWWLWQFVPA